MNAKALTTELYSHLEQQGSRGRIVAIEHLHELQHGIEDLHQKRLFDEKFYQVELTGFDFSVSEHLPDAQSLIVVAMPQPQVQASFTVNGNPLPLIIPPIYAYSTDKQVQQVLEDVLKPEGYHVMKAKIPWKILAVRSGLAQYGKNNITYVEGLGSFQRLVAFFTDVPCIEDNWGEPQVMERCITCSACAKSCPTEAIGADRFLLHAERCITFFNEFPGEFPEWIDPAWHNCIVGCLFCQKCCPVNKHVINWIEAQATFSEVETQLLLQGVSETELPADTLNKLEQLGIIEYLDLLPRNLKVLIEKAL